MQEYELKINEILNAYNKNNIDYKFLYVMYNISNHRIRPFEFPMELWNKAIMNAPSTYHTPHLLRGFEELEERIKMQIEVVTKVQNNMDFINWKHDKLKTKTEILHEKILSIVNLCRDKRKISGECKNSKAIIERTERLRNELRKIKIKPNAISNKVEVVECLNNLSLAGKNIYNEIKKINNNK